MNAILVLGKITTLKCNSSQNVGSCSECELYWSPVCGIDGNTHINECMAKCSNIQILCHQSCPCQNVNDMKIYSSHQLESETEINGANSFITPCKTIDNKNCKFPYWYKGQKEERCIYAFNGPYKGKYVCPTKVNIPKKLNHNEI